MSVFDYEVVASKGSDIPYPPTVHIIPKRFSSDKDGWPRLSPELMSEGEIDGFIRSCKQDLDRVGELAKAALRNASRKEPVGKPQTGQDDPLN